MAEMNRRKEGILKKVEQPVPVKAAATSIHTKKKKKGKDFKDIMEELSYKLAKLRGEVVESDEEEEEVKELGTAVVGEKKIDIVTPVAPTNSSNSTTLKKLARDGTTNIRDALQSSRRAGTARPMTTLGREVRLSTASLTQTSDGKLINVDKLNLKYYSSKTGLAMVLSPTDRFPSEKFTCEPRLLLGLARIHDQLHDFDSSIVLYKKVLALDASCVESIACLGAHFFYSDQPELSIRYYRRLLQMGVNTSEVWNNIGMCCFFSSQYDMALGCFERALGLANDDEMSDLWYNIGHIGISLGDLGLAYQAFKVAVSINSVHGEALNNIAVLEMRRQKFDVAKSC
eukprot:gene21624-27663_t